MRLLVTDAAAQPPRQATAWLIMTLGIHEIQRHNSARCETGSMALRNARTQLRSCFFSWARSKKYHTEKGYTANRVAE